MRRGGKLLAGAEGMIAPASRYRWINVRKWTTVRPLGSTKSVVRQKGTFPVIDTSEPSWHEMIGNRDRQIRYVEHPESLVFGNALAMLLPCHVQLAALWW